MRKLIKALSVVSMCTLASSAYAAKSGDISTVSAGISLGLMHQYLPTSGFELNLNLGPKVTLTGGVLRTHLDFKEIIKSQVEENNDTLMITTHDSEIDRTMYFFGMKYYPFAGSFNTSLVVSHGTQELLLHVTADSVNGEINEKLKDEFTTANLTIGNDWRWKHAYVGFDWLGYAIHVDGSSKRASKSSVDPNSDLGKSLDDLIDFNEIISQKGGPIFIKARVGFGF